jgi:hypothetical protein
MKVDLPPGASVGRYADPFVRSRLAYDESWPFSEIRERLLTRARAGAMARLASGGGAKGL